MSRIAMLTGLLLIGLGVGGYFAARQESWTDRFTPTMGAVFGLLLLVSGLLAIKGTWRKNAMHAAVVLGLLAFVFTANALVRLSRKLFEEPGLVVEAMMAVLCAMFLILALKSFIDARRSRAVAPPPPPEPGRLPAADTRVSDE